MNILKPVFVLLRQKRLPVCVTFSKMWFTFQQWIGTKSSMTVMQLMESLSSIFEKKLLVFQIS